MKQLALVIFLALGLNSYGQSDTTKMQPNFYDWGLKNVRSYSWKQLLPPQDTVFTKYGLSQKGGLPYNGNASYWSQMLVLDTSILQPKGFKLSNGSKVVVGEVFPAGNSFTYSTQTYSSVFVGDSIVNNSNSNAAIFIHPKFTYTSNYSGNGIGSYSWPEISEDNTGDWTGTLDHANLTAFSGVPVIRDGASGTITSTTAFLANLVNASSTFTVSNGYLFRGRQGVAVGTFTNLAGLSLKELGAATNNTYLLTGTDVIPTGNWNLYHVQGWKNWLGRGTTYIGDSTDNSSGAELQVTGEVTISGVGNKIGTSSASPLGTSNGLNIINDFTSAAAGPKGIYASPRLASTSATYTSFMIATMLRPTITATNTQDWNNASALTGLSTNPTIETGATGTVAAVYGIGSGFSVAGMTTTNYYGFSQVDPTGAGTITNQAGITIAALSKATNNTHILTGTGTIPSGNWNIYSSTAYNNYLGTGITSIGSATDNSTGALLQVTGGISATTIAGTGTAPTLTVQAGAGTGASATVAGTSLSGTITLNIGTSPSTTAGTNIIWVAFAAPLTVAPKAILAQVSDNSSTSAAFFKVDMASATTSGFYIVNAASLASLASTTRLLTYVVL